MPRQSVAALAAGNIARMRKLAGLTQAQVAERISVEKESISRMESGKIILNLDRLQQFAELYGCSVNDLLRDPSEEDLARSIAEMIRPLNQEEQNAIIRFVGEAVRLFCKSQTD